MRQVKDNGATVTTTKLLLLGALTLAMGSTPAGQPPVPSSATSTISIQDDPRLAKLPPGLREKGRQILAAADEDMRWTLRKRSRTNMRSTPSTSC